MSAPVPVYLDTDERRDVAASLDECLSALGRTASSPPAWKWVFLSLHSALQGAMVCHLSGSSQLGALKKDSAKKWLAHFRSDSPGPEPELWLAPPLELFGRLSGDRARLESGVGEVLMITTSQRQSFDRLNMFRNQFTHFTPMLWAIEMSGAPVIVRDMLDVIEMILADPYSFRHSPPSDLDQIRKTISDIRLAL